MRSTIQFLIDKYHELRKNPHLGRYLVIGLGIGFVLLTIFVHLLPNSFIDVEFSEEMQEHRYPWLDAIMKGVSWFGHPPVAVGTILGTAGLFLLKGYKRESLFVAASLLSAGVAQVFKILVDRPRPTEDLVTIIEHAKYQSFPSGHTIFYIAFFGFLVYLMHQLEELPHTLRWGVGTISLALIFMVPFSRVYLGAHWLTDVSGGAMVGLLFLYGSVRLYERE